MHEADARSDPDDIWLWLDGESVRWWSGGHTQLLGVGGPGGVSTPVTIAALRDQRCQWGIHQALSAPLADLLAQSLARHERVRLHLSQDLDTAWHSLPYPIFVTHTQPAAYFQ